MIAFKQEDKHCNSVALPINATPQILALPQKTVNTSEDRKMKFELKAYQFYILFMLFLLITLAGLIHIGLTLDAIPYSKYRNLDNYSELTKLVLEHKNMTRDEIELSIEKAKALILSNEYIDIAPFEMYSYLVNYKTLKHMYKNIDPPTTNKHEKRNRYSGEFLDSVVDDLIEAYKMEKASCIKPMFDTLQILTRLYKDNKGIVDYLNHQREKLSEYCSNSFKE